MGYRLEMSKVKYSACGSKLYGYIDDEKKLKSHQWLLKKGYIDGDEYWDYGCNPRIVLRPYEFKEFIELYNEDFNKFKPQFCEEYPEDYIINQKEIQELIKNKETVLLEWW